MSEKDLKNGAEPVEEEKTEVVAQAESEEMPATEAAPVSESATDGTSQTPPPAKPNKVKAFFKSLFGKRDYKHGSDVQVETISVIKSLKIFKGIKMPWVWLIIMFVAAIAQAVFTFELTVNVAEIINSDSGAIEQSTLTTYIVSGIATGILTIASAVIGAYVSARINHDMRCKLWDKILKLRQKEMGLTGELLVSRVAADCDAASGYFGTFIGIASKLFQFVYYFVGMYQINVTLSNFALIFIPVSIGLGLLMSFFKYRVAIKTKGFLAQSTAYLVERSKDLALIKTCNSQDKEIEIGEDYFHRLYTTQMKTGFVGVGSSVVEQILQMLTTILPFVVGAVLFAKGEILIGFIVAFNQLIGGAKDTLNTLIQNVSTVRETNGATARISKITEFPEEVLDSGVAAPDTVEDITFENVQFGYFDGINVLKDVSFQIPKNKVTAILGRNGSGKTTSFKLIERFYDINGGAIKFGNDDISEYTLQSWREKVCLIAQGGELMSGTLRSNICYGREDVTEEEFQNAVQLAHVSDFASALPDGYDSTVLADGSNFSGGQRQCIAIARAMLSKKPYLLLDEATCNLDAKREHDVIGALENLMENRTTVIIAHSLSTIRHADHVVILGDGKVEATGTPKDILKETDNYLNKMMGRANA